MEVKVSLLILSALSDAQELNGLIGHTAELHRLINWAKWLTLQYPNTEIEINPETEAEKFAAKFPIIKMQMG
jgi:hypothetical protein